MQKRQNTDKKNNSKNTEASVETKQEDRYSASERAADFKKYAKLKHKK